MRQAIKWIEAVVSRILFVGMSIQIILGLFWMCCSFAGVQDFSDSSYYIEVSKSLLCDEYTGILYPFLLKLVRGIDALLGVPFQWMLYLLQIGIGVYAGYVLAETIGVRCKWQKVWGSLALLTFPMLLQCHMAILPNSLASSFFFLMISYALKIRNAVEGRMTMWVRMHALWLVTALLMPEYLLFGAIPVVCSLLCCFGNSRYGKEESGERKIWNYFVVSAAFLGLLIGVSNLTQVPGSRGKVHAGAEAAWFRRTTWTCLETVSDAWPQELKMAISEDELTEVIDNPEKMASFLQPLAEEQMGAEKARKWFGSFANETFRTNYKQILAEMGKDAAGYVFPPLVTELLLDGRGYSSLCMRNYEVMRASQPLLTRYYMDYSLRWLMVGALLAALMQASKILKSWKHYGISCMKQGNWYALCVCVLTAGAMALWYTLQEAGMWDYKKGLFVGGVWVMWMVYGAMNAADEDMDADEVFREESGLDKTK